MKRKLTHSLHEMQKVNKELYEVFTTDYWDNGTYTTKDISYQQSTRKLKVSIIHTQTLTQYSK
jgi:hypothetical protein